MTAVQAILGFGVTGKSVARHLSRNGEPFKVFDTRSEQPLPEEFRGLEVNWQIGHWPAVQLREHLSDVSRLIVSPGVRLDLDLLLTARALGLPIVSDIDLFFEATTAPVIGVTGTNGKSTVVSLVGHICRGLGEECGVGGNIGLAALDLLIKPQKRYVLELSSFQLERSGFLPFAAATVLNISDDHLDHHGSIQNYRCAKLRIYRGARHCVFNRGDSMTRPTEAAQMVSFGLDAAGDTESFGVASDAGATWLTRGDERIVAVDDLALRGAHNLLNTMAALALLDPVIAAREAAHAATQFAALEHRFQFIRSLDGVEYVNDSKATNVGATLAALQGLKPQTRVILIAGGDAKGADLGPLAEVLAASAVGVVALGKDSNTVAAVAESAGVDCAQVADIGEAVVVARRMATDADMVLLSPACSSLDMYRNFSERGELFVEAVRGLPSDLNG